jgi:hypothetical protein
MFRSRVVAATSMTLVGALASLPASAALPEVDLSGFGTAGFAITDTSKALFARSQYLPTGADDSGDVGVDSLFALQGTVHLSDMFSVTTQAMVRRLFSSGFQLDVPVFFAKADLTHDLAIRLGRIQLPAFMSSDYRQVGYSNTWLRPPVEVYGQIPFDSEDGVDMIYRTSLGPADISSQVFFGRTDANFTSATIQSRDNWGGNFSVTLGPLTVRAGRDQSQFTSTSVSVQQLLATVSAAGFPALAARLNPTNVPYSFTDYGFSLDETHLTLQGEFIKTTAGAFVSSTDGQYILGGYRIDKFTPYAIFAREKVTSKRFDTTIPQIGPLIPLALGVNQLINSVGADQHTISGGIRWDLHQSVDLKFQVDHVSPQGNGLFINPQPGFRGPVWVAGLVMDFVF